MAAERLGGLMRQLESAHEEMILENQRLCLLHGSEAPPPGLARSSLPRLTWKPEQPLELGAQLGGLIALPPQRPAEREQAEDSPEAPAPTSDGRSPVAGSPGSGSAELRFGPEYEPPDPASGTQEEPGGPSDGRSPANGRGKAASPRSNSGPAAPETKALLQLHEAATAPVRTLETPKPGAAQDATETMIFASEGEMVGSKTSRRARRPNLGLQATFHMGGTLASFRTAEAFGEEEDDLVQYSKSDANTWRFKVRRVLLSKRFDTCLGVVIVVNSIMIGMEIQDKMNEGSNNDQVYAVLENLFMLVYIAELCARAFSSGWRCLNNGWVRFDAALVGAGVLGSWVLPQFLVMTNEDVRKTVDGTLNPVFVLRVFRLFRLARALRLLVRFRTLWMLVQGLISSSMTIMYTMGLMTMIIYIFSCIGVEVITIPHGRDPGEFGDLVRTYWSSIPVCMLSLIRFVTLDSVGGIYEPMIKERPRLIFFFMPFILIVSVALMNLVTAVIVEGALEQAKLDREAQAQYKKVYLQSLLPHLREIFDQLDEDGSGLLSLSEVQEAKRHPEVKEELETCLGSITFEELFQLVDDDGSGEVSIEEFCEGLAKIVCSESPVELFMIMKQLTLLRIHLEGLEKQGPGAQLEGLEKQGPGASGTLAF